jgi:hypothetical protein
MTTLYVHMCPPAFSDLNREIDLRRSRTDRVNYDLDVDSGSGTCLTLFSLTPEDVRDLGKSCARHVAQLVVEGKMTMDEALAAFALE